MCLTCQIINEGIIPPGGIVYKDDLIILHHCLDINIAGYFILSPIRHLESIEQLNQNELFQLAQISKRITEFLICESDIERVYILSLGEETSHFHFHLFPRYNWMLKFPDENIRINRKIDGAKLFSFIRNRYKTDKQEQHESKILSMTTHIREKIMTSSE